MEKQCVFMLSSHDFLGYVEYTSLLLTIVIVDKDEKIDLDISHTTWYATCIPIHKVPISSHTE